MAFLHSKTQYGFHIPNMQGHTAGHEAALRPGAEAALSFSKPCFCRWLLPSSEPQFPYVGALSELLEDHSRSSSLSLQDLASRKWEGERGTDQSLWNACVFLETGIRVFSAIPSLQGPCLSPISTHSELNC